MLTTAPCASISPSALALANPNLSEMYTCELRTLFVVNLHRQADNAHGCIYIRVKLCKRGSRILYVERSEFDPIAASTNFIPLSTLGTPIFENRVKSKETFDWQDELHRALRWALGEDTPQESFKQNQLHRQH